MTSPYKIHEKIINGHEYKIMAFPARYGLNILAKLSKYGSNVLRFILPAVKEKLSFKAILDTQVDSSLIDNFIYSLQESLGDGKLIDVLFDMVKYTSREGEELNNEDYFNLVFAENYEELFMLLKEVIVINFLSQNFMKKTFVKMVEKEQKIENPAKNG